MNHFSALYRKYQEQLDSVISAYVLNEDAFTAYAANELEDLPCIELEHADEHGFLYYHCYEEAGKTFCRIPLCGYFAESEQMMVRLFQALADRVVPPSGCDFSVQLYARDEACIRAFHMMQFGTMAETCVRLIGDEFPSSLPGIEIRVPDKPEIEEKWPLIWSAVRQIIDHLKKSPVFYPGTEFTEELYHDYFMSEDLELLCAFKNDTLVGIIEWNNEENLLTAGIASANIGEVYVVPELRASGLAQCLLYTAAARAWEAGVTRLWVEHGTANPNARGFWNRYFETVQYELVRSIPGRPVIPEDPVY